MKSAIRLTAVFLALSALASQEAVAQPSVMTLSGTLAGGQALTIIGAGFGTKAQVQPVSWDDFEGGVNGNTLGTPAIGPAYSFLTQSPNPNPSYSNTKTHAGNMSAVVKWTDYSIDAFGWANQGPFNEVYVSFWRFMAPQDPATIPTNHKILYIVGNDYSLAPELPQFMIGALQAVEDSWKYAVQNYPTTNFYFPSTAPNTWNETTNTWQRWEVYVKLNSSTSSSDGEINGWIDGQSILSLTGLHLTDVPGQFTELRLGHMFQGYHPGGTDQSYFDDVYTDSTQTRVEIGNASTWSACTHREIQVPSAWSPTSITITLNQGSFTNFDGLYIYIVDASGVANESGYPLCVDCPAAPLGVVEQ